MVWLTPSFWSQIQLVSILRHAFYIVRTVWGSSQHGGQDNYSLTVTA